MIPNVGILMTSIDEVVRPTRTYHIERTEFELDDRINGYTDDLEAVIQSIYLILSTERYKYIIYSWDYGIELLDLIGQPMPYVEAELPRRISEALLQDDRITKVDGFEFTRNRNKLLVTFYVTTNHGKIHVEKEVAV